MRLLLVEDDAMIGAGIRMGLRQEEFVVDWVQDGRAAELALASETYAGVLLDLGLPRKDGFAVLEDLRRRKNRVPVLIITARDAVADRVRGLNQGADDYVVKPFDLDELLARVRALLRRSGGGVTDSLAFEDLRLDVGKHRAWRGERELALTRTEFALLELFLRNPDQVLSRPQIYDRVWGYDFGPASNSLDVYVGYLRHKTEAEGESRLLHNVRGVGFVLRRP